jgi:putative DNA primase/helicase
MFCEALSNDGAPLDIAAVFTIAPAPKATPAPKAEPSDTPDLNSARLLGSGVKLERCPKGTSPFQHAEALCKAMPAAVSGSGGHVALLRLARALRWGLELDEAQTVNLISELYNPRCEPAWSDTEIAHKAEHAGAEDGAPYARGALLPPDEPIESPPQTESPKPSAALLCELSKCHFTDSGNADRFALTFGEDVRYCTPRKKWLRWTGQRWEWDECEQIVELAKRVARAVWEEIHYAPEASDARKSVTKHALYSESRQSLTNLVTLAQSKCALLPSALDSDPWLFNVRNGTLDLRTAELRPHAREDLITKLAPVDFDPSATSELWDRCLEKFTGSDRELSAYLQRALGLALCGQVREKAFWFAYGEPDGGKSTFLNAVAAALGDYHVAADSETWLARHDAGGNRGDLVRLLGARLVTSSEFKPGGRFDVKLMKAITGGDPITAAAKYEGEITFQPAFSLWLAGNDAPTIHDDDEGMWRRVRRVPFTKPIPRSEQDAGMPDKLRTPEVGAAILTWAVAGCLAWQLEGLGSSAAVERSNTDYRAEMDRVAPFFEERCVFELDAKALASELRGAYDMWCRNRGVRSPLGSKEFAKKLREKLCDSKESNGSTVWRGVRVV